MVSRIEYAFPAAADAGRGKQAMALVIPAAVPLTMVGTFYLSNTVFGPMPGYLIGFLVYWGFGVSRSRSSCWDRPRSATSLPHADGD